MNSFEYASPRTEAEALDLLNDHGADTAVLAGGTDFVNLMRRELISPRRVVDLKTVPSLKGVHRFGQGVLVGALTTLEDVLESPLLAAYRALHDVIHATRAIQIQANGTVGGDLCHAPNCWYFRSGYGLLATQNRTSLVDSGDNRYHAILGNAGPAKFVSASRFAPGLIASEAQVRIIGPEAEQEEWLPLEAFYTTPKTPKQNITVLKPGQLLSHVWIPSAGALRSATYEVMQMEGLDWPQAAAASCLDHSGGFVRSVRIVMGHVAPTPWVAQEAADWLLGKSIDEETAQRAGELAVARATPLSKNGYKVQLAATAVKRSLLRAVDLLEGGV